MNKEYQQLYGQLSAPQKLKDETKLMMKNALLAEEKEAKQNIDTADEQVVTFKPPVKRRGFGVLYAFASVAAAAMLVIILIPGVILVSGYGKNKITKEEYQDMASMTPNVTVVREENTYMLEPGIILGQATTADSQTRQVESVGNGTVVITSVEEEVSDLKTDRLSDLNDVIIFVTCSEDDKPLLYRADFRQNNRIYTLEGENVTEDEFVNFLIERLKGDR